MTDELWRWSAADLARAIARGAISSEDATRSVLGRIESVNPRVNAVVDVMADEALQAAREADTARRSGTPCGPLHGVPTTVKVNVDTKGRATTNGVVAFRDLGSDRRQPGRRQPAQCRRRDRRPHQYARLLASLVHRQRTPRADAQPVGARV